MAQMGPGSPPHVAGIFRREPNSSHERNVSIGRGVPLEEEMEP